MNRFVVQLVVAALTACHASPPSSTPASLAPPRTSDVQQNHDHDGHAAQPNETTHNLHRGHHGGGMTHGFKNAEQWAKVFDDPARDAWQRPDEVVALLSIRAGMTVVDLGAGTGYFVGRLANRAGPSGTVIATDLEADMVTYLEQRGRRDGWRNVRPLQVAADDPGLGHATVDRILVVDVWHHLGDRRAYAAKLAEALRPGGFIVVVDFDLDARMGPPPEHRLAPERIIEELESAGLIVELAAESLPEQYAVIARSPAP
jgi:ubiquinone/menaquinone biosynthesis C-methylase UbiE